MSESNTEPAIESLIDYENLKRQKSEYRQKIQSFKASKELLGELPSKISYRINAPINKVCFIEGKIVNTNQVYIKYDDYLIQKSCQDAQLSQDNKIDSYDDQINLIDNFLKQVSPDIKAEDDDEKRGEEFNIVETLEESMQYGKQEKTVTNPKDQEKQCMFITDAKDYLNKEEEPKMEQEKQCMFITDTKKDEEIIKAEKAIVAEKPAPKKERKVEFKEESKRIMIDNPSMNFQSELIVDPTEISKSEPKPKKLKSAIKPKKEYEAQKEKPEDVSISQVTPGDHNMDHLQRMIQKAQGFGSNTKSNVKIEQERKMQELKQEEERQMKELKTDQERFTAEQKIKEEELQAENNEPEDEPSQKKSLFRQRMEKRG